MYFMIMVYVVIIIIIVVVIGANEKLIINTISINSQL